MDRAFRVKEALDLGPLETTLKLWLRHAYPPVRTYVRMLVSLSGLTEQVTGAK